MAIRSPGKYAGGIGLKENFRRPLRPDARSSIPEYWRKYMRHDWWWGFLKPFVTLGGAVWFVSIINDNHMEELYQATPEELRENRRLLQVQGDDSYITTVAFMDRALKKAQVRAFISGDPVWEEAVHRDFFDNYWWWLYHKMHGINPEENEYIPIPLQNRQKFDFYQEKLARRNEEIEKRGKLSLTVEERKIWLTKLRLQTRDIVNSTSIAGHNHHSLDFARRKSEYYEALEKDLAEKAAGTSS